MTAALREVVDGVGVGAELQLIMSKRGSVAQGMEPLVEAIDASHHLVRGSAPPPEAEVAVISMWRDTTSSTLLGSRL